MHHEIDNSCSGRCGGMVVVATVALAAVLLGPAASRAEYHESGSNPLRIASYVVHPVGQALEWLVFRPLYAVGSRLAPVEREVVRDDERCRRGRPSRHCGDRFD